VFGVATDHRQYTCAVCTQWVWRRGSELNEAGLRNSRDLIHFATSLSSLGNVEYDRGNLAAAQNSSSRALAIRDRLAPKSLDVAEA